MGAIVLDVSNNRTIDERTARQSGCVALIAKATEGTSYHDRTYKAHRKVARDLHIPFGAYLFLRSSPPGDQALAFIRDARIAPGDIEPIIDAEVTDGYSMSAVAARVDGCAKVLEAHGYRPILYASSSFWFGLFEAKPALRRLRVWEAQYPGRFARWLPWLAARRIKLRHGASVVMWQWTDAYAVGARRYDASRLMVRLDSIRWRPNL